MSFNYPATYVNSYPSTYQQLNRPITELPQNKYIKHKNLEQPMVIQYTADTSGCALYRLGNPAFLLNYSNKARVQDLSVMVRDPAFYVPLSVVRIQRQAKDEQRAFVDELCKMREEFGFKLQYEIDDIVFGEDIPLYNANRGEFLKPNIRNNIEYIMDICDEITVTCPFMRDYYRSKLNNQRITVVPNFQPRWWFDRYYDQNKINQNYDKHKNKPRILYCGSAGHYDIKKVGVPDDLTHVIDVIKKTVNDYQWVFVGAFPLQLESYVRMGLVEFHKFVDLLDYPSKLFSLDIQAAIAPLANNTFNKAKSDIKWTEMCAMGIPCVCQDLCTYEKAWWKFNTGDEMIDQLKSITNKAGHYKNIGSKLYKQANSYWLDNEENIGCYVDLFKYDYKSPERKYLNRFNNE